MMDVARTEVEGFQPFILHASSLQHTLKAHLQVISVSPHALGFSTLSAPNATVLCVKVQILAS